MKRTIISALLLFSVLLSFSQVSLTLINNAPAPGDSTTYIKIPFIIPGDAGPDKVWDFSAINITGEKVVSKITFAPAEKDRNSIDYDIVLNDGVSAYYCKMTGNSIMEIGGLRKDYSVIYSDPVIRMVYPFVYGDHFTDNFAGIGQSQNVRKVDFSGVFSVTADAFGTLILPDHAYMDVLRVRTESSGLEINQCHSIEVKLIHYLWYVPGHRYPVLNVSITERRISGRAAEIERSALLWSDRHAVTPAGAVEPKGQAITDEEPVVVVYPNPFGDKLNYCFFLRKSVPAAITLTDVTGRTSALLMKQQMQSEGLHSGTLEPADFNLTPGVYYLRFVFDKQVVVRKVIKL
jgi:hypothetical protein